MRTRRDPSRQRPPTEATQRLTARIDAGDGGVACTLFPVDVDEEARLTTWVTAHEDAFVHCSKMR